MEGCVNTAASTRSFVAKPKGLNCPSCGSAIELRALGAAASVVCSYCGTALAATDANLRILSEYKNQIRVEPLIPLGSRGRLKNVQWEVIGFQQRGVTVDAQFYAWREYVLWNPFKGFRYLSEYYGHWNFITPLQSLPAPATVHLRAGKRYIDRSFAHFQTATATTNFVLGEFSWMVTVGESVEGADYISPPFLLSSESSADEVNWSLGEYTSGKDVWSAFALTGAPPAPYKVFANQPNPRAGRPGKAWRWFALMSAVLIGLMLFFAVTARREKAFEASYTVPVRQTGEKSFVTDMFELRGRRSNVQVEVAADLNNTWVLFAMALINDETGEAFNFAREVSYYSGRDADGNWTEGSPSDEVILPGIPSGRYYLRIEPETDPQRVAAFPAAPIRYTVRVTRDVPYYFRYLVGILLLLIPPVWITLRNAQFEGNRWSESDYGGIFGSSGGNE